MNVLALAALALFPAVVPAQSSADPADPAAAVERWRAENGAAWRAEFDASSGFVHALYGGHTAASGRLQGERGALDRARSVAQATRAMTGLDPATLVEERALLLPLSSAGSSDKYTASFRQVIGGVPVVAGHVCVLLDLEGRALSVDSSAVPGASSVRTVPIREAAVAAAEARRVFASLAGSAGTIAGEARLVLDRVSDNGALRAVLAWEIDVFGDGADGIPRGLRLRLADLDLALTSREELVHTCDVTGTVFTRLTPGTLPDEAGNATVQVPLAHVQVSSPQGNAVTDANGNFNIVGASAPLAVSVSFDGPFTTPTDAQAPVYVLPATLTAASG